MKNSHQERMRNAMKQYHIRNPWPLSQGCYIPHSYSEPQGLLSWWDDCGFIQNKKRVMIWWVHPRMKYSDAINDKAWEDAGLSPDIMDGLFEGGTTNWKKVGKSRKKVASYTSKKMSDEYRIFYDALDAAEKKMREVGIDCVVKPTINVKTYDCCRGISICVPLEIKNEDDVRKLIALTKKILNGTTTIEKEFPKYRYDTDQWLAESTLRVSHCD